MAKRAFTLIELLVVIAIIAILAAILFPVFAQAKEAAKQSATLSNGKQLGLAFNIYTADYDDLCPSSFAYITGATERYWWNYPASFPAGSANPSSGYLANEDAIQWANAILPYNKNTDIYQTANGNTLAGPAAATTAGAPAQKPTNYMMNGLLHQYPLSSVQSPSSTPLIWQGWGKTQLKGFAFADPRLTCAGTGPCRFSPDQPAQAGVGGTVGSQYLYYSAAESVWTFKQGAIFINTDSSAKFLNVARGLPASLAGAVTARHPWANLTTKGQFDPAQGSVSVVCSSGAAGAVQYHCAFRPDYDR